MGPTIDLTALAAGLPGPVNAILLMLALVGLWKIDRRLLLVEQRLAMLFRAVPTIQQEGD